MDTDPSQPKALWTALEVARFLKISRASIYNLAERGALPVVRIGALLRFHPDDVYALARVRAPATLIKTKAG